jgi:hypothetical protein
MSGLSSAENVLTRLPVFSPPSVSLLVGKPRSLCGPPTDSYFFRTWPLTTFAPVAGL